MIMIECFNFQMIAALFIFSESLEFEKRNVEKKLVFSEKIMSFFLFIVFAFSVKNLFLTDSSVFCLSVFSIILMIQISAFLKALLSDFLKFLSLISALLNSLSVVLTNLLISLVSQNMCLCCSKQLIEDSE